MEELMPDSDSDESGDDNWSSKNDNDSEKSSKK